MRLLSQSRRPQNKPVLQQRRRALEGP
jgi:hypothetical protein